MVRHALAAALVFLAVWSGSALADWNPGDSYKMHFPQLPDPLGFDVNFQAPLILADDWKCSETGPVTDIHFWFSAQQDWLDLNQPLDQQIFNIHVSIHADIPAGSVPYSQPGAVLWQRDYTVAQVKIQLIGTGPQFWFDPATGLLTPNDHNNIYQCNITKIAEPFYQKKGHIYWLDVSVTAQHPLGWKSADFAQYPPGFTGHHYQDDAVWGTPAAGWQDLHFPAGPNQGQSMDLAFVITNTDTLVWHHKMHFPQEPDPTGADIFFTGPPRVLADDWKCTGTGPITDIHFWFSAFNDWLDLAQPLDQQIFNIHVSIHDDVPAGPGTNYSHPGNLLWQRDYPVTAVTISRSYTEGQDWYDPSQGTYLTDNHKILYRCDIENIVDPFQQQYGHIYWLDVFMQSEQPLGWKSADEDQYPQPYTGNHFLDDGVWGDYPNPLWQELRWPVPHPKAGQSFDLAFVVTPTPPTGVGGEVPKSYRLEQNYPNPFNPTTTIRYALPVRSTVELAVFTVDGKLVRVLDSGSRPAGTHEAAWDGRDASGSPVASGVYFYRLNAGSFSETKKMVLTK